MSSIIEKLAEEYKGKVKIGKVQIYENMELAKTYKISAIPTLILIKDGEEVERFKGFKGEDELRNILDGI